jgi:hypothetical protein
MKYIKQRRYQNLVTEKVCEIFAGLELCNENIECVE